jgi:hypothetical protein
MHKQENASQANLRRDHLSTFPTRLGAKLGLNSVVTALPTKRGSTQDRRSAGKCTLFGSIQQKQEVDQVLSILPLRLVHRVWPILACILRARAFKTVCRLVQNDTVL